MRPLRLTDTAPVHADRPPVNARRAGRIRALEAHCSLGPVIDLSGTGMRVRARARPRMSRRERRIMLTTPAGVLAVRVELVWARRVVWREWEVGVRFVEVNADVARAIQSVLHNSRRAAGLVEWGQHRRAA